MNNQIEVNLEDNTEPKQSHDNIHSCEQPEVDNAEVVTAPDGRDKLIERLQRENKELLEANQLNHQWEHKYFETDVENNELRTKNDELEDELMDCKEQIHNYRKLEIANKELQGLLEARETRLKNLSSDNRNLHAQLEQFKTNDTNSELAKRELELDNHKLKLSNIELRCVIDAKVARLQILEKEKVSLEEELLLSQKKIRDFDHLQNVHNELKGLLEARDLQFAYLQKQNKDLKTEIEYESDKHGRTQAENIELVKELDALMERAENLKNDKYNLIAELELTHKKFEEEQKRFAAITYRMGKIDDVLKKAKQIENLEKENEAKLNDAEIESVRQRQEIGRLNALVARLERLGSSEGDDQLATSSFCSMLEYEEHSNRRSWHNLIRELVS